MDRKWMFANRLSPEYENGVNKFIDFAQRLTDNPNRIKCPCIRCGCIEKVTVEVLKSHLFINGIDKSYTVWIWHDESVRASECIDVEENRGDNAEEVDSDDDKL